PRPARHRLPIPAARAHRRRRQAVGLRLRRSPFLWAWPRWYPTRREVRDVILRDVIRKFRLAWCFLPDRWAARSGNFEHTRAMGFPAPIRNVGTPPPKLERHDPHLDLRKDAPVCWMVAARSQRQYGPAPPRRGVREAQRFLPAGV